MKTKSKESFEVFKNSLSLFLELAGKGIVIDDLEHRPCSVPFMKTSVYYFSVPQFSELDESGEICERYEASDSLIQFAKNKIYDSIFDMLEDAELSALGITIPDLRGYVLDNCMKFYARVRKGEVLTKSMSESCVNSFMESLRMSTGYTEV